MSSPVLLGMLAFYSQGPILFFGLFIGVIVDRCDCRRLVLTTQIGITVLVTLLSVLTLNHLITGALAIAIATGLGLISAFNLPGRQSLVVDLGGSGGARRFGQCVGAEFGDFQRRPPSTRLQGLLHEMGEGLAFLRQDPPDRAF